MIVHNAKEIRLPPFKVRKMMLGRHQVYPKIYLEINRECLWLTEENNYTEIVEIKSNTNWKIY